MECIAGNLGKTFIKLFVFGLDFLNAYNIGSGCEEPVGKAFLAAALRPFTFQEKIFIFVTAFFKFAV